jgi:hypothetical protein
MSKEFDLVIYIIADFSEKNKQRWGETAAACSPRPGPGETTLAMV